MNVQEIYFNEKKKALFDTLKNAMKSVPFYKDSYTFDLPDYEQFTYEAFKDLVPILTKSAVQSAGASMLSYEYDKKSLFLESTSGSEGQPLLVYKPNSEKLRYSIELWQRRRKHLKDLSPEDKFARFYAMRPNADGNTLVTDKIYIKGTDIHIPLSNMGPEQLDTICLNIIEFGPRWMHGPSTAIFNIASHALSNNIEISSLELVELNGEFVKPEHVPVIENAFGCKVVNNYGCREFWTNAYSCPEGDLRIVDEALFIESVTNEETGQNELLYTSLRNKAWPLIRYKVGDAGTLYYKKSNTGFPGCYCIDLQRGRIADYFELSGGVKVNAVLFSGVTRGLQKIHAYTSIKQYQVLKHSSNLIEVLLRLNTELLSEADIIDSFDHSIRQVIPETITIKYSVVRQLDPDPITGKVKDFKDLSNNRILK